MHETCDNGNCPLEPRVEALEAVNEHFPWALPLWVQAVLGGQPLPPGS